MPTEATIRLSTPLARVAGVQERQLRALERLGLTSVGQLVRHFPFRHEFQAAEDEIASLPVGALVTARGEVSETRVRPYGRRPRFEAALVDESGCVELLWFNSSYLSRRIHPGMRLRVEGKLARVGSALRIVNPRWEEIGEEDEPALAQERLRPVYPSTEDLPSRAIESVMERVLPDALPLIEDHLPEERLRARDMPALAEAHRMIHQPKDEGEARRARRRLAYDELLLLQLGVQMKRVHLRRALRAPALKWSEEIDARIRARFPFALTVGQESAVAEIVADVTKDEPANRLIQGDVGSGKTAVALYAALLAVASEKQAALMAPTELLAEQHYLSITEALTGSRVRVELVTGSMPETAQEAARARIASGAADIAVGTHALIAESVAFHDLALAVIDEQHRFGVHQRARLREKASDERSTPHVLVMTATPIPRTLALTLFGDLDVSTIDGLPPGRRPIQTRLYSGEGRARVYDEVRGRVERGEQAYVVVPSIDAGERAALRGVRETLKRLQEGPLTAHEVVAIHGRLKRETRERIMARFRAGKIDVLVATTVIEVGVDAPGATVMVVEQAERFGLAQLHQLRGRVGRGEKPSACLLIADPTTPDAAARLEAIVKTTDGFELAERDFEIRGPGEILGARQSGLPPFRIADLARDAELLGLARRDARAWIERSPLLAEPDEELARKRLFRAFGEALGLADVG